MGYLQKLKRKMSDNYFFKLATKELKADLFWFDDFVRCLTFEIALQMTQNSNNYLDYLSKLEEVAQDILIDKEQIVNFNRRSNALREAKRALQADLKKDGPNTKTWMCFGNMFIKCPKEKALGIVEKDQALIDEEIKTLRDNLKPKVENMRNLEGKPESRFNLKPLTKDELNAMKKILYSV